MRQPFRRHPENILDDDQSDDDLEANCQTFGEDEAHQQPRQPQLVLLEDEQVERFIVYSASFLKIFKLYNSFY